MIDEILETVMVQMLKDRFDNKNKCEEKYIISKQELYSFMIKFLNVIKEVYDNNNGYY